MYLKSAQYYDALYRGRDYPGTAQLLDALIQQRNPAATSLLDVACGTGRHMAELSRQYEVAGLDLSEEFLEIALTRCPAGAFHVGDMADFKIGRKFDAVICMFSSIAFVKTGARFVAAIGAMAAHLNPGGVLIVEPWFTPENYWVGHLAANYVDEPELKISWMYVSELRDRLSILDIHFQVGTPSGVTQFRELHEMGLFTREETLAAFAKAGLDATYQEGAFFGRGLYVAQAPGE